MIRVRMTICIVLALVLLLGLYGLRYRATYTDITQKENFWNDLYIAECNSYEGIMRRMEGDLKNATHILRITPVSDMWYEHGKGHQTVKILQVFQGEDLHTDQEIIVTNPITNRLRLYNEKEQTIEQLFVNKLMIGKEYLLFCAGSVQMPESPETTVYLLSKDGISQVFCYDEVENVILPVDPENTYVPYASVKNNEFFAANQETLDIWEEIKQAAIAQYPRPESDS